MTRNDFELMARALKAQRPNEAWNPNKLVQWDLDVKAIAGVFSQVNARFNPAKFFAACGGLFHV